jgi:hypothetical protein
MWYDCVGNFGRRADVDVVITFWNFLSRVAIAWVECNGKPYRVTAFPVSAASYAFRVENRRRRCRCAISMVSVQFVFTFCFPISFLLAVMPGNFVKCAIGAPIDTTHVYWLCSSQGDILCQSFVFPPT